MRSKTKTRILLTAAFILLSLGWAQLGWSVEMVADLRDFSDELRQEVEYARAGPYGAFVRDNIAAIGGVYALIALFLLSNRERRNEGWNNLWRSCIALPVLLGGLVVEYWLAETFREIHEAHGGVRASPVLNGGAWLITLATSIWPLLIIAFGLTLWIGIPVYLLFLLFTLPSVLFVILRLLVRLPVLTYHHLHYLFVPHPAERVIVKYEKMRMERGVKVDHAAFGEELSSVMYNKEREGIPGPPIFLPKSSGRGSPLL